MNPKQGKPQKYAKAKISEIIQYSFGGIGSNIPFLLMMTYLNFFYTDIMGISAYAVSSVMLITRIFDAVTDPLMGILGDRTRTKWGRYRPWIIFGAPLLGLCTFLVFYAPEWGESAKIIYVYITYILYSTFSDFANIPYHSLTPVISQDPDQRNVIVSLKQGMGVVAQLFITTFGLKIVQACGDGRIGWAWFGGICGIILTISFWVCANSAKMYDNVDTLPPKEEGKVKVSTQLKLIFGNRPLLALLASFFFLLLSGAVSASVNMYYFKYILGDLSLVPITSFITLVVTILVIPLMPIAAKIMGKKRLYVVTNLVSVAGYVIMWAFPTPPMIVICTAFAWASFFSRFPGNLGWSMLPECVDYSEWKFHVRGNSTITSSLTFINKMGTAAGGFLTSFVMAVSGFIANTEPTAQVLDSIVFLRFGLPALMAIISTVAIMFYNIDSEKLLQMRGEIDARKNA